MNTNRELENWNIACYMGAVSVESDNDSQEITLLFPHCPDSTLLFPQYKYTLKELRYHKSAEWLERVIEKITSEPNLQQFPKEIERPQFRFEVEIERGICSIFENSPRGKRLIARQGADKTHKAVYTAIIEFIHTRELLDDEEYLEVMEKWREGEVMKYIPTDN